MASTLNGKLCHLLCRPCSSTTLDELVDLLKKIPPHDLGKPNRNGQSPLCIAVEHHYLEAIPLLLKAGAPINGPLHHPKRSSPLSRSTVFTGGEITSLLLKEGADPDVQDAQGWGVLHWAVWHHNDRAIRNLLNLGANPLLPNINGNTPLHIASSRKNIHCCDALLQCNRVHLLDFLNSRNLDGETAEDIAGIPWIRDRLKQERAQAEKAFFRQVSLSQTTQTLKRL